MSGQDRNDDLTQFEAALTKLTPRLGDFNRDEVLFAAARAAARAELRTRWFAAGWFWSCTAAAMAVVALTMAVLWQQQRAMHQHALARDAAGGPAARRPSQSAPSGAAGSAEMASFVPPASGYLVLRERVLCGEPWESLQSAASRDARIPPAAWPLPRRWSEGFSEGG